MWEPITDTRAGDAANITTTATEATPWPIPNLPNLLLLTPIIILPPKRGWRMNPGGLHTGPRLKNASSPTEAFDPPHFGLSGDACAWRVRYQNCEGRRSSWPRWPPLRLPGAGRSRVWQSPRSDDSILSSLGGRIHAALGLIPNHLATGGGTRRAEALQPTGEPPRFLPCRQRVPGSTRIHHPHVRSMVPGGNPGPCRQDHRGRLPECATNAIRPCWNALDVAHSTQPIRTSPTAPPAQATESSVRAAQHEISPHHGSASVH